MNAAEYPNRDAVNKALGHYLDAMFQFVSECLDEPSIRETLRLLSVDDLRKKIEVKDIADLIKKYWSKSFKAKFKIIDRDDIRYYDARSVTSLIIEGRNQVSHQLLQELDPEFTRSQLFFIAEILGKIKRQDAQHKVEGIRDELFNDTAEQLEAVSKAVEVEKAEYKKSIAEVEKRLAAAKKDNEKLSKQRDDNAAELDKKKGELEKLSGQLVSMRSSEKENEKHRNSISEHLKKIEAAHSTCEERITSIETERDDYKERFETKSKELEAAETEWQACEDNLKAKSDQLEDAVGAWMTSVESLTAMRELFETATIGNMVFPSFETDAIVRILDRRNVDKKNFLLGLLEQKQPTIIYVQSEERIDQLLTLVGPEKADVIGKCNERTSEAEEREILGKLENGELIAVVSNTAFSTLTSTHCIEHFVFCHLVPGLDKFFKQCEPAFTSEKKTCLHLTFNSKQDIDGLAQRYPDRKTLEKLYSELKKLTGANGDFIRPEKVYDELDIAKLGIETGLAIFEELQLLERNDEGIKLLPPAGKKLDASEIYRRGEQLKSGAADFQVFQFEQSIEQIWEALLKELNVDNKQILEASNVYEVRAFQDAIEDSKAQSEPSTDAVENDSKSDAEVSEAQFDLSTDAVENDNTMDGEDVKVKQPPKSTRKSSEPKKSAADKFREAKSLDERKEIGRQVAELRINSSGSKPSWRSIRTKLGLKNDEFHKVIRLEDHFRESVVERIESFEDGWQYDGKLEVLLGFEPVGELLERIKACKPTPKVEAKKEAEPQVEESRIKRQK